MGLIEQYQAVVTAFPTIGLLFDLAGAILVLGPELDFVAMGATKYERWRLGKLLDGLEKGDTSPAGLSRGPVAGARYCITDGHLIRAIPDATNQFEPDQSV